MHTSLRRWGAVVGFVAFFAIGCDSSPGSGAGGAGTGGTSSGGTTSGAPAGVGGATTSGSSSASTGGAGVGGGSTAYPNEPPGYVRFAEYDGSVIPPFPGVTTLPAPNFGLWYAYPKGGGSNLTLGSDPAAPQSAPNVVTTRFPMGLAAGTGPVNLGGWDAAGSINGQKSAWYLSVWFEIVGPDYQNNAVGTKWGWTGYGANPNVGGNEGFFMLIGDGTANSIMTSMKLQWRQQGATGAINWGQNVVKQTLFTCGAWHHIEANFVLNTLANTTLHPTFDNGTGTFTNAYSGDGILQIWIDGQKTHDYNDVAYITPGNVNKFTKYYWNPTYGGGGIPRTRQDDVLIDHIYMSGLP